MAEEPRPHSATQCAREPKIADSVSPPIAPPISLSAVYRIADLDQVDAIYQGQETGYVYSRDGHPNRSMLEVKLAEIEGGEAALITASGMAAISSALLSVVGGGGHIALSDDVYGKTSVLVGRELSRLGIEHSTFDATRAENLAAVLRDETQAVLVETISNPLVRLADLLGLAGVCGRAGVPLIVDHTFAPLLCSPLALGATAVVHSLTKLIGGHSDVLLGGVIGSRDFVDRAASVASTFGMTAPPFDCWLALRGLSTLDVRSSRIMATALDLAERLQRNSQVQRVHYPGLPDHPDWPRARELLWRGFGSIMTIDLGDRDRANRFIRALDHVPFAPSLGDVQTTLSHPHTTSHRGQPAEKLRRLGIGPGLVRLSIGLEHPDDLWADLSQALDILV